jgi:hypothetical protein
MKFEKLAHLRIAELIDEDRLISGKLTKAKESRTTLVKPSHVKPVELEIKSEYSGV